MVNRTTRILLLATAALVAATLLAPSASGARKMWIGFQDDRAFKLLADRTDWLDRAVQANATMIRTTVVWADIAPVRPAKPGDHTDPAYQWASLDELVQNASARNLEVVMTILGTPPWANRGLSHAFAPRKANMFKQFTKALATRYSGKAGFPEVKYYTIGNEFNTARFLMPQFKNRGKKSVAPAIYVNKFILPGKRGLRAGNRRAEIGIGVTSPRGRKKNRAKGAGQHFPAEFMRGVGKACKNRCNDMAFAHHPYTNQATKKGPNAKFKYPAVAFNNLNRFRKDLKRWFGLKKGPRIWITEYGFFSNPPNTSKNGVPVARHATFLRQAVKKAKKLGYVDMFIWFIMLDDAGAPNPVVWEASGGVYDRDNNPKPAYAAYQKIAGDDPPAELARLSRRCSRQAPAAARPLHARRTGTRRGRPRERATTTAIPTAAITAYVTHFVTSPAAETLVKNSEAEHDVERAPGERARDRVGEEGSWAHPRGAREKRGDRADHADEATERHGSPTVASEERLRSGDVPRPDSQPRSMLQDERPTEPAAEHEADRVARRCREPDERDQRQQLDRALRGQDAADDDRGLAGHEQPHHGSGLEERQPADQEIRPGAQSCACALYRSLDVGDVEHLEAVGDDGRACDDSGDREPGARGRDPSVPPGLSPPPAQAADGDRDADDRGQGAHDFSVVASPCSRAVPQRGLSAADCHRARARPVGGR